MVTEELAKFLPEPVAVKNGDTYTLAEPENSIGKINGFHGSFGILVRAYTYIRVDGPRWTKSCRRERHHQRELRTGGAERYVQPGGRTATACTRRYSAPRSRRSGA